MPQDLSPITLLSNEILGYIFELNSDMGDDDAYEKNTNSGDPSIAFLTLLRSSRVCLLWRDYIINSPSLWGRVVNLNSFTARVRPQQWETLMSRTGNAPLHLRAKINHQNFDKIVPFIISVLERYWARVMSFDVVSRGVKSPLEQMVPIFSLQAPLLVSFRIKSSYITGSRFTFPEALFSNYAPRLRGFYFGGININLHNSWGSQIRSLRIETPRSRFNPSALLQQISQLPLLESLALHYIFDDADNATGLSTPIHLPNLQHVGVVDHSHARQSLRFLGGLKTGSGCCLRLDTGFDSAVEDVPLVDWTNVVEHYAQGYFEEHQVNTLSVRVTNRMVSIEELTPASNGFFFKIEYPSWPFDILNSVIKKCQCGFVKTLALWIDKDLNFVATSDHILLSFARLFPNVEILKTSPYTLDLCYKPSRDFDIPILPMLRELWLDGHMYSI